MNVDSEEFRAIFQASPPPVLYHYASCATILEIMKSKMLWASNIRGLNDAKEVGHAEDVLRHALENYLRQRGMRDEVDVKAVSSHFNRLGSKVLGHCVASFSEDGDVLSQWRAYGADGQGISVGFSATLLEIDGKNADFILGKCIYNRNQQYAICFSFWASILSHLDVQDLVAMAPNEIIEKVETFLYTVGIFLKHPAFLDEREWRLVSSKNNLYSDVWRYRATSNGLTSYVELPLPSIFCTERDDEPLSQVPHFRFVLGPRAKQNPTCAILQAISHSMLGQGYGVSISGIPYSA